MSGREYVYSKHINTLSLFQSRAAEKVVDVGDYLNIYLLNGIINSLLIFDIRNHVKDVTDEARKNS